MQTVVLGSYAYQLTGSSLFVGILAFAQLGPLLLLSIIGGAIADALDRRKLLIILQTEQLVFSLLLAVLVAGSSDPSKVLIVGCVLAIGIGNALNAPAWGAVLPSLVGERDLGAAISLNSTMINGSRVIGPAAAGLLYPILGPAWIFTMNAATYVFVILALLVVRFPAVHARHRAGHPATAGRYPGGAAESHRRAAADCPGAVLSAVPAVCQPVPGPRRAGPRPVLRQPRLRPAVCRVRPRRVRGRALDRHDLGRRRQDAADARSASSASPWLSVCSAPCGCRRPPTR